MSPPLVMCATACLAVLASAGYRAGDELAPLPAEMLSAHTGLNAEIPEPADTAVTLAAATIEAFASRPQDRASAESETVKSEPATVKVASGNVFMSLPLSARLVQVPQPVLAQLADALDRRLVLRDGVPLGARFRLAYDGHDEPGVPPDYRLLALELEGRNQWHDSYYFDDKRGSAGFFDRNGRPIGRSVEQYPVRSGRITSRFSERRMHPLLHIIRPHYGVDFAAPTGTPVRAVASGTVIAAAWQGGSGRFVKLRHRAGLATGYAHLARIVPGLEPGARVRRGQIIGYVGSTGLATGAHLHFVVYRNGRYVDPMTVSFAPTRPLRGRRLAAFRATVSRLDQVMGETASLTPMKTALLAN